MAKAWIDETLPQVMSSLTTQHSFKSQFSALSSNAGRVQICLVQLEVQHWAGLNCLCVNLSQGTCAKCYDTANMFRMKANDHFRVNNRESAIQLYSRAICFAPQTSTSVDKIASELPFAYISRCAIYFQLGQYDNALKDIEDALARGYGQFKPIIKYQLFKCNCLIRLGRVSEAKQFLNTIQKPTNDKEDIKHWNVLFGRTRLDVDKKKESNPKSCDISLVAKLTNKGLFKSNEKMSSFSTKVAVKYDEVKGRHLVAQEDIEFDDILAVSRPYATLLDSKNDFLKYCHHCCRDICPKSIRPIACIGCSSVVYCSEECRTESVNSYHRYECGQTDLLVQLPKFARMSLRMLYSAGMDQIRSVVNSASKDANRLSEQAEGHYSHVYQLVHHSTGSLKNLNIPYDEMLKSSMMACLLLQVVKFSSFQTDSKLRENDDWKFIGGILLRHLLQLRFNTFDYSTHLNKENESKFLLDLCPALASTLNHSCRENARLESPSPNNQHVCFLQAARPILAGTEITISYLRDKDQVSKMAQFF